MLARSRRFLLLLIACVAVAAVVTPQGSQAQQSAAAPNAAATERAALIGQLQSGPAANAGVADAEKQLGIVQAELITTQKALVDTNARLRTVQSQIAQNQQTLAKDQAELASMIRSMYEQGPHNDLTTALLSSDNFNQAFDRYRSAQHVSDQLVNLVNEVAATKSSLETAQSSLEKNISNSQTLENALSAQSGRLTAMIAARNAALAAASVQTQKVVARLDTVDNHVAAAALPAAALPGAVNAQGPCGNHFAFGQCTWYVASRRCIPWLGNAYQWWANARAAGFAEGHVPQAGAVVVWSPGGGGSSSVGHVAYVEAVGPSGDVPAGSFKLSEMNWGGWDRVTYRILPNNSPGISGFIYGKA